MKSRTGATPTNNAGQQHIYNNKNIQIRTLECAIFLALSFGSRAPVRGPVSDCQSAARALQCARARGVFDDLISAMRDFIRF